MGERRPIKIILVGSSGVGKTSLINSYFDQAQDLETCPTVAPAFCSTSIRVGDGQPIELHIWDTAGQERFQSIGGMFYRDSDIAFVCTDMQSINTVPDWIERVHRQVPECVIFLVGTKADLLDATARAEFLAAAREKGDEVQATRFALTSAAQGEGVKELFRAAAQYSDQIFAPSVPQSVSVAPPPKGGKKAPCC
jgi:small GTP-binding protein